MWLNNAIKKGIFPPLFPIMKKEKSYLQLSSKKQNKLIDNIQDAVDKKDVKRFEKLNKRWHFFPEKKTAFDKHFEKQEKREARRFERETNKDF